MTKPIRIVLVITAIAFVTILVIGQLRGCKIAERNAANAARAARLDDYCRMVANALEHAAAELERGNPGAVDRVAGPLALGSEHEILLCAQTPPDLGGRDACALKQDYACLAELARREAQRVRPR